jgi:hypothetical protein
MESVTSNKQEEIAPSRSEQRKDRRIKERHIRHAQNLKNSCNICNDIQLFSCTPLVFEQELRPLVVLPPNPTQFQPASLTGSNPDDYVGIFKIRFKSDLSSATFRLRAAGNLNPNNVITEAHIHVGSASVNGPIVVTLYPTLSNPFQNSNAVNIKGTITNADIAHFPGNELIPVQINSVASLYDALRKGLLYVNVHTTLTPAGIIRGQLYLSDEDDDHNHM